MSTESEPRFGQDLEAPGIATRPVLLTALGVVILTIVTLLGVAWVLPMSLNRPSPSPTRFPDPAVSADQRLQREGLDGAQRHILESYDWVDQAHTRVRVPIERAMKLLLDRPDPLAPLTGGGGAS